MLGTMASASSASSTVPPPTTTTKTTTRSTPVEGVATAAAAGRRGRRGDGGRGDSRRPAARSTPPAASAATTSNNNNNTNATVAPIAAAATTATTAAASSTSKNNSKRGRGGGRGGRGTNSNSNKKPTDITTTSVAGAPPSGGSSITGTGTPSPPNNNNNSSSTNATTNTKPPPRKQPTTTTVAAAATAEKEQERVRAAAAAAIEQQNEQARLLQQEDAERVRQAAAAAAKIQDALYYLQTGIRDPAAAHAASRTSGDWVEQVRREFDALKKTGTKFKVDLKKCTAFCKRVKSGALYNNNSNAINIATPTVSAPTTAGSSSGGGTTAATTANPSLAATATAAAIASIQDDMAALNLSRHVEEVLAAVLDSHPKVPDVPLVTALAIAMHTRYPEFLPMLVPALWNVVWPSSNSNSSSSSSKLASAPPESGSSGADATKQRRVYVRLLTEFLLHGLLSASDVTKLLQKCLGEWTSMTPTTADGVSLAVALCKTAGFEVLGQASTTTRTAMELLRSEHQKHQQEQQQQQSGQTESDNTKEGESTSPPLPNAATIDYGLLLEQGMALVHELEPILAHQRAVSEEMTASVRQHLLGTYQTLCALHVSSNQKLQKLEKRCHQDRLVSGSLTAQREKGLADAHKICDSLRKSVEVLADGLDEPMPHVSSTQDDRDGDENGTLTGTGVEVWTKESGGQENLGPFDDEETRAFYCDIPDLLTTIPPALLGISDDEIERRKEANAIKYGLGGASAVDDSSAAADAVVLPTSEAQLDAAEQGEILAEDEEVGEKMDAEEQNKDTPHYRLMLLLDQELPECNRREQIDEIAEKFGINHGSSKNSRKRLLKTMFLVPRSRLDLLPYYSRMVATLDRVWGDIAPSLTTDLEQQFHGQAKFKKNQNVESRFRTARYIGELIKFRAAPPIVVFRCIERCIEDFTGMNVEVACCVLESCGRYLYRLKHTHAKVSAVIETLTRLSKAKNLDDRLQSLLKAAFYTVKPPPSGPRKKAKEYPPLETYLRNLLLVRLEPSEAIVSLVSKQLVRFPWNDPSVQCGSLVCKIMLKACRKGRYKTIEAVASVAAKLRTQRAAGEVTIRLIDAVIEEIRWALDNPNFRDQQRIITYTRLLGELYCAGLLSGTIIIDQLYCFVNSGHEIPDSLREVSKLMAMRAATNASLDAVESLAATRPVFNSASGASQVIQEDEEMDDSELVTHIEAPITAPQPVAASPYSLYDPRVPSSKDPPNSSYRITLVCTLLEVVAKSIVSRNNIPRLKGFLAAFQRYLFTKSTLPTDVEFSLLDTFDLVNSQWKRASGKKTGRTGADFSEESFPQYSTWSDAHTATVVVEESEAKFEDQKRTRLEGLADESKSLTEFSGPIDERSLNDDDTGSLLDDDDESMSVKSRESVDTEAHADDENRNTADSGGDEEHVKLSDSDVDENEDEESGDDSETDEDEDEFDEDAYMRQLEEEAFERELRMVTMEAIEKGKIASRKQVGESMISGSQMVKRKPTDPSKPLSNPLAPTTGVALGGEVGISFQVLKKGNKGKVEAKELIVPVDTNLAMVATRQDDAAARERDEIKQRVLRYEAQSESSGGNVYLEQDKLQKNRNRPLSMDVIDKNFGTSGGNLHPSLVEKKSTQPAHQPGGRIGSSRGGRGSSTNPGRGGRGGRSNAGGRALFG